MLHCTVLKVGSCSAVLLLYVNMAVLWSWAIFEPTKPSVIMLPPAFSNSVNLMFFTRLSSNIRRRPVGNQVDSIQTFMGYSAPAGLKWLYMWNSSSVNLSVPPFEPCAIHRCTWPLPQAHYVCKVCQLCCLLWVSDPNPNQHQTAPPCTIPPQLPACRHPLPLLPERLLPI